MSDKLNSTSSETNPQGSTDLPPAPIESASASTPASTSTTTQPFLSPAKSNNRTTSTSDSANLLETDSKIKSILNSDSALDLLLDRLKQSLSTGEEFSKFIKKKAQIEDDHYNQLKKFASNIRSQMKNNSRNLKSDSLQFQMDRIIEFDETLYGVGLSYVTALNTMYDELTSLINTITRSRKTIKDEYKKKDRECMDAISAADKARSRYNHFCEELDKLKGADPSKKSFGRKTVSEQEDGLQRKIDSADLEYKSRVATCKKLKDEILVIHRPNNAKKLKNLILEMDIALNVQLQKYATWCENLIMNSGVMISPLQSTKTSMRTMASSIDNEKDLYHFLLKSGSQSHNKSLVPVDYQVHPSLVKTSNIGKPFLNNNSGGGNNNNNNNNSNTSSNIYGNHNMNGSTSRMDNSASSIKAAVTGNTAGNQWSHNRAPSSGFLNTTSSPPAAGTGTALSPSSSSQSQQANSTSAPYSGSLIPKSGPNQDSSIRTKNDFLSSSANPQNEAAPKGYLSLDPASQPSTPNLNGPKPLNAVKINKQPTFGVSIEEVITFAGVDNVPLVVRKCIEVIETYGIDLVGIYRTSSNFNQVKKLGDAIDQNFTNYLQIGKNIDPGNVLDSDIFCIASLLKRYFLNLPEPLVTNAESQSFIETVKLNDEHHIAKKLHHLVYNLPDGAYFTLRALIFHLNKIAAHEAQNRMNAKSLAIIWGPVIFNDAASSAQDLSYKSKVVEELMSIATDIFEEDE